MGKAKKVGKNRQDKYYHLAKEQGFRSRASFKLVQLNRRFDFLSAASHGVLDLCAAPGGWLQVARKYMPVTAPCIGVDLVGIRSIPGCSTIAADITTDTCRAKIKRLLKETHPAHDAKLDAVLNDGSPNMGTAWIADAYDQSELTLHALHLATDFLRPGGSFVTKVFRSNDYNSLLFVFNQLFSKVVATKPSASRNESAEIYVCCKGYLAPKSIDPRILDPKHVFQDMDAPDPEDVASGAQADIKEMQSARQLLLASKSAAKKRARPVGYPEGATSLFKAASVRDFVAAEHPLTLLADCNTLQFDPEKDKELLELPDTTPEFLASCKDLRVLGRREFKVLLKWRQRARKSLKGDQKDNMEEDELTEKLNEEDKEDAVLEDLRKHMEGKDKRVKKRLAKLHNKQQRRIDMKMILPGDQIDMPVEEGLFSLVTAKGNATELLKGDSTVADEDCNNVEDDPADMERKQRFVSSKSRVIRDEQGYLEEVEEQLDDLYQQYLERKGKKAQKLAFDNEAKENEAKENGVEVHPIRPGDGVIGDADQEDEDSMASECSSEEDSEEEEGSEEPVDDDGMEGEDEDNDETQSPQKRHEMSRQSKLWFSNPVFSNVFKAPKAETVELENIDENEDEEMAEPEPRPAVKKTDQPKVPEKPKSAHLTLDEKAERMAIARVIKLGGRHRREELIDGTWNRQTFEDGVGSLPGWFRDEDVAGHIKLKPVTKEEIDSEKARLAELKALPSRKEAEARGRKKMKQARRFEEIKKRANSIADQADVSSVSKMKAIEKLYHSTGIAGGKAKKSRGLTKQYVVATPGGGRKNVGKGGGGGGKKGAGRIKYVDKRLKSDKRGIAKSQKKKK